MKTNHLQRKTLLERVLHAVSFEGLATLILAPTAAANAAIGGRNGRLEHSARHHGDGLEPDL